MVEIPADPPEKNTDVGQDDDEIFQPQIGIEVQFIKDLSFENPIGSNATAMMTQTPEVNVEVATNARPLEEGQYEVSIIIRGEAKTSESTVLRKLKKIKIFLKQLKCMKKFTFNLKMV